MSNKIHNGPGVVPGRYAGEAIPIHSGPTPEQLAFQQHKTDADGLAGRICAAAAETARSTSLLLELVGEFDAIGGMTHWTGFKSLAHWLSWSCAMTPGVAREHVRIARALRRMPTIAEPVEAQSTDGACIGDVPAGTSQPAEAVCQIENVGSIETATAQKLACDNPVLGAVVDKHGSVLALGRTKRLVSTAQRRA